VTARTGLAALLLVGSACAGCRAPQPFTFRHGGADRPAAAPVAPVAPRAVAAPADPSAMASLQSLADPGPDGLRVLHLGDFGERTSQQDAVAGAAAARHARTPFALALFAGDLLYPCGPDAGLAGAEACTFAADGNTVATPPAGPPDPAFAERHERPLAGLLRGKPPRTLLALGNHDVYSRFGCGVPLLSTEATARRKACLNVAHASLLWSLPARHYLVDEGPARFVVLDSNTVYADYGGFTLEAELAFLSQALVGCEQRACFVLLHHPPVVAGVHVKDFDNPEVVARMARLEAVAGGRVRAWLAGHDHDLQHLRTARGVDVLVSGNGATARPGERFERTAPNGELIFASTAWGFGLLTVRADGWDYRFEETQGASLHCCAASGTGRCEPVECAPAAPR
jgi:hypothetical protein